MDNPYAKSAERLTRDYCGLTKYLADNALRGRVQSLTNRVSVPYWLGMHCPAPWFTVTTVNPEIVHVQFGCVLRCTTSGTLGTQLSRPWVVTKDMDDDMIVRTLYLAVERFVLHELHEGFTFDGRIIFNPHQTITKEQ